MKSRVENDPLTEMIIGAELSIGPGPATKVLPIMPVRHFPNNHQQKRSLSIPESVTLGGLGQGACRGFRHGI
jgi:hypothetical protein